MALKRNDPVGEFGEPSLAPHRFQFLQFGVGRADGPGLLRSCRLSQAARDDEGDEDRLRELDGHDYADVEVRDDLPFLPGGWVQSDLLEVDREITVQ